MYVDGGIAANNPASLALSEAHEILERLAGRVDLIVDGGATGREPTSVIDLSSKAPEVLRKGAGDTQTF